MNNKCIMCGSHGINPNLHDRGEDNLDLCDVCYWHEKSESRRKDIDSLLEVAKAMSEFEFCGCGNKADKGIIYTHVSSKVHAICNRCADEYEQDAKEVNAHEMRYFNGSYGLVTWEYVDISKECRSAANE